MPFDIPARRIARFPEVRFLTARSRTTIWRLEKAGKFPRRVRCGENSVGWFLDEVLAWLESRPRGCDGAKRIAARDGNAAK